MAINTQELQGQWNQLRGQVKQKWGQLTDDDLQIQGGNVDQMVGRIQQRTGEGREVIEKYLTELTSRERPRSRRRPRPSVGSHNRRVNGSGKVTARSLIDPMKVTTGPRTWSGTTPASRSPPRSAWASSPGSSWDWRCGHVEPHRGLPFLPKPIPVDEGVTLMVRMAITFAILALVAAFLGFGNLAGDSRTSRKSSCSCSWSWPCSPSSWVGGWSIAGSRELRTLPRYPAMPVHTPGRVPGFEEGDSPVVFRSSGFGPLVHTANRPTSRA